jgi:hypothetical protein
LFKTVAGDMLNLAKPAMGSEDEGHLPTMLRQILDEKGGR